MYYPMLDLISRFNLKVRSQGLLKHVPAVHARGNKWGGFLLSVLKFPCARWHSCYSKRVCMHCHAGDPSNTPAETLKYKDNPGACILAPLWSIQTAGAI